MAKQIIRYRTSKPPDGHLAWQINAGAALLAYSEFWHTEKGWELVADFLLDTRQPMERRYFFLGTAGADVTALGDYPEAYLVGYHRDKGYLSYLFETTHLTDEQRRDLRVDPRQLQRGRPHRSELGRDQRRQADRAERERRAHDDPGPLGLSVVK